MSSRSANLKSQISIFKSTPSVSFAQYLYVLCGSLTEGMDSRLRGNDANASMNVIPDLLRNPVSKSMDYWPIDGVIGRMANKTTDDRPR